MTNNPTEQQIINKSADIVEILMDYHVKRQLKGYVEFARRVMAKTQLNIFQNRPAFNKAIRLASELFYIETRHLVTACIVDNSAFPPSAFFRHAQSVGALSASATDQEKHEFWEQQLVFFENLLDWEVADLINQVFRSGGRAIASPKRRTLPERTKSLIAALIENVN